MRCECASSLVKQNVYTISYCLIMVTFNKNYNKHNDKTMYIKPKIGEKSAFRITVVTEVMVKEPLTNI